MDANQERLLWINCKILNCEWSEMCRKWCVLEYCVKDRLKIRSIKSWNWYLFSNGTFLEEALFDATLVSLSQAEGLVSETADWVLHCSAICFQNHNQNHQQVTPAIPLLHTEPVRLCVFAGGLTHLDWGICSIKVASRNLLPVLIVTISIIMFVCGLLVHLKR